MDQQDQLLVVYTLELPSTCFAGALAAHNNVLPLITRCQIPIKSDNDNSFFDRQKYCRWLPISGLKQIYPANIRKMPTDAKKSQQVTKYFFCARFLVGKNQMYRKSRNIAPSFQVFTSPN